MNNPTSTSRLAITYRPVGDLIPDPRNAHTHPPEGPTDVCYAAFRGQGLVSCESGRELLINPAAKALCIRVAYALADEVIE